MEFSVSVPEEPKKAKKKKKKSTSLKAKEDSKEVKLKKKKKKVEEEWIDLPEEPKKAKKKKKVPKVTIDPEELDIPKAKKNKISRIKENLNSILQEKGTDIQTLLEENDSDSAISLINKRMLQTFLDLIPYAEHNIRETAGAKGVYQLTALGQSIREALVAIQQEQDRSALGLSLVNSVIQPAFLELTTKIVNEYVTLESELRAIVPDNKRQALSKILSPSRLRIASNMQDQFKQIKGDIVSFMER